MSLDKPAGNQVPIKANLSVLSYENKEVSDFLSQYSDFLKLRVELSGKGYLPPTSKVKGLHTDPLFSFLVEAYYRDTEDGPEVKLGEIQAYDWSSHFPPLKEEDFQKEVIEMIEAHVVEFFTMDVWGNPVTMCHKQRFIDEPTKYFHPYVFIGKHETDKIQLQKPNLNALSYLVINDDNEGVHYSMCNSLDMANAVFKNELRVSRRMGDTSKKIMIAMIMKDNVEGWDFHRANENDAESVPF